jgi:hypothetical protein
MTGHYQRRVCQYGLERLRTCWRHIQPIKPRISESQGWPCLATLNPQGTIVIVTSYQAESELEGATLLATARQEEQPGG